VIDAADGCMDNTTQYLELGFVFVQDRTKAARLYLVKKAHSGDRPGAELTKEFSESMTKTENRNPFA